MARIAGVDLPRDKRLDIALTYIFGLGRTRALETCVGSGVSPSTRVRDLTDEEVVRVREWIGASYQGLRHRRGLPVNGQRTHTNARTRKGPKRTVAGKKKAKGKK